MSGFKQLVLFASVLACVSGMETVASPEQELKELKEEIWAGFTGMMQEVKGKVEELNDKESFKPYGQKHGSGLSEKIQKFKESHPEMDVSPQSLISLSTEQQQKMSSEMTVGQTPLLCLFARGPITLAAMAYCSAIFGWNMDLFNVWACFVSFLIPFEAVCMPALPR